MKLAKIEAWIKGYLYFLFHHLPLLDLAIINFYWHFKLKGHKHWFMLSLKYLNNYREFMESCIESIYKAMDEANHEYDLAVNKWRDLK